MSNIIIPNKQKILQPNELGYGIMVEYDAGVITPELNTEILSESFKFEKDEPIYINCILQKWGVKNRNGRIYPKEVLLKEINRYSEIVNNQSSTGEADHPDSSIISLHNISHLVTKMWWGSGDNENVLYGKLKLLVTKGYLQYGVVSVIGDKILFYLQNGVKIGISSRGVGSLKEVRGENLVQDDFELVCFDLVSSPSTFGAYLFPDESTFNKTQIKNPSLSENKIIDSFNKFLLK